jgi:hypothetical protein
MAGRDIERKGVWQGRPQRLIYGKTDIYDKVNKMGETQKMDEMKDMADSEKAFWKEADKPKSSGDFLNVKAVEENGITHIKLLDYLGMKMTDFEDPKNEGKNYERPNFIIEVVGGKNKGEKYATNFTRATGRELGAAIGNKDFKTWIGRILTTKIVEGTFTYIEYGLYVKLD